MNRNLFFISVLLIGLFLFWIFTQQPDPAPSPSIQRAVPQPKAARPQLPSPPAEQVAQSHPPMVEQPVNITPSESPDGSLQAPAGTVPFDLVGHFVVAYGDVLLGSPTVEDFPKFGFIEAPKIKLWSQAEIPFSIDASLPNPERVHRTIEYFNTQSPVRFIPFNGQSDSIVFMPGDDLCLSYVGRVGGHQPIYLSAKCGEREIAHELLHALGFIHEQSRPDRDRYVRIQWQNIEEARKSQFVMVPDSLFEPFKNRPFDYRSAMLYPPDAFAKDHGLITIESLGQSVDPVPIGLSEEDLARLYLLYNR